MAGAMTEWDKRLIPQFTKVVQNLRPSLLVDLLLERGLLLFEEYCYVRSSQHMTEEEQSRVLIELLRKKGPRSLDLFCEVLLAVRGQEFIATNILGYKGRGPIVGPSSMSDEKASSGETLFACSCNQIKRSVYVAGDVVEYELKPMGGANTSPVQVPDQDLQSSRATVCIQSQPSALSQPSAQSQPSQPSSKILGRSREPAQAVGGTNAKSKTFPSEQSVEKLW